MLLVRDWMRGPLFNNGIRPVGREWRRVPAWTWHPVGLDLTGAFFQFDVSTADDREDEVGPRRQFLFAIVPAVGTEPEAFVVFLLGFLNEAFQADVETNLVAVLVKCQ